MSERVLYQFPVSHYCEKARWVLDFKRLPYSVVNQLPGFHSRPNKRLTGSTTVPVLRDGNTVIGGSHAIALHLETVSPEATLVPRAPEARERAHEIVHYFDDTVGPAVRRFVYSLLVARPKQFRAVFFKDYKGLPAAFGRLTATPVSRVIARMYQVNEHSVAETEAVIGSAAEYVERALGSRDYLVAGTFTLADLTVASLLGPVVGPAGSPWDYTLDIPEFSALRARMRQRKLGDYITRCYALHRTPQ